MWKVIFMLINLLCLALPATILAQKVNDLDKAQLISSNDSLPCAVFTRQIKLDKTIKKAMLTITAHGIYEAQINGHKVGRTYFMPGFTSYDHRLQYQSHSVAKYLKPGNNQIAVSIAGGWYSGVYGGLMKDKNYGADKSLLLSLQITYDDGTQKTIYSDKSWQTGEGPIQRSGFYEGETHDTRKAISHLHPVRVLNIGKSNLILTSAPPVTAQETFRPRRIWQIAKDTFIVDFGQNLAGFVRLKVKGKPGDTVKIRHAEMLDEKGHFWTANLREAKATDTYILNGRSKILEPHFTYHGFRYARISGVTPTKTNCTAVALYSNLRHTGTFSCSNPMFNQLQHNITWSMNSNFVDIPTDCPQRSERLGWTGDAQIFCSTAAFNKNVKIFYQKYLADLKADQGANGGLPNIVPDVYHHRDTTKAGAAGWGDAATIIPWTLYEVYGDKQVLKDQYASMKAWVNYETKKAGRPHLWKANGYGDWYAPGDSTSMAFIDQCFYMHSTELLVRTAKVLHQKADEKQYQALLDTLKAVFVKTYSHFDTKATSTQTAYILALQFDLLPEDSRQKIAEKLAEKIKANNNHLATGFLGTPYILPVLTRFGYTNLAYTLLNQRTCPSWLYPVTKGATTIWEKWDAVKPDGTLQQTSFNHYAYGAVGQWLYETVAGIRPAAPGYKTIRIAPKPGGGLAWAKASYQCKYGTIRSEWHTKGKTTTYKITIPPNTRADIDLPGQPVKQVKPGQYRYTVSK
jgi:alpha-L-rhamnosidase